jgi:hypothetical protein
MVTKLWCPETGDKVRFQDRTMGVVADTKTYAPSYEHDEEAWVFRALTPDLVPWYTTAVYNETDGCWYEIDD